jgi:hypothetical protein
VGAASAGVGTVVVDVPVEVAAVVEVDMTGGVCR